MGFFSSLKKEVKKTSGPQEYKIKGITLVCPVCGGTHFSTRKTLLTSSSSALMKLEWADKQADNYICSECGYIFWFMPQD